MSHRRVSSMKSLHNVDLARAKHCQHHISDLGRLDQMKPFHLDT